MGKYIIPETDIDEAVIQKAAETNAVIVVPSCIDKKYIIVKAKKMNLYNKIKSVEYFIDMVEFLENNNIDTSQLSLVYLYPDYLIEEFFDHKYCYLFMES